MRPKSGKTENLERTQQKSNGNKNQKLNQRRHIILRRGSLEQGGQLDVSCSVDIYSLGKVIYYMLSGGKILHREELSNPTYASIFDAGGRDALLKFMLQKMICEDSHRYQNMKDILVEITRIETWDRRSLEGPFSDKTRSKIEKLQVEAMEARRLAAENLSAYQAQRDFAANVNTQILQFLRSNLEAFAAQFTSDIIVEVHDAGQAAVSLNEYIGRGGLELVVRNLHTQLNTVDTLQFAVCTRFSVRTQILTQNERPQLLPPEDTNFMLLPVFRRRAFNAASSNNQATSSGYYLSATNSSIFPVPASVGQPNRSATKLSHGTKILAKTFLSSEWPKVEEDIRTTITWACDIFIDVLTRNRDNHFPR